MATITVSIAYADTQAQHHHTMTLPCGSTLYQAIEQSGYLSLPSLSHLEAWCQAHNNDDPNHQAWYVGIYGQKKRLDTPLLDKDRVEIYRALSHDPMTRRKSKAKIRLKKLGHRP